jgi:hypothetical protein
MAHSIELLFDDATEAAVRRDWTALAQAGLPSQGQHRSPTNRPHVTLCRRLSSRDLAAALEVIGADDLDGTFARLRRWDGDARVDTLIG